MTDEREFKKGALEHYGRGQYRPARLKFAIGYLVLGLLVLAVLLFWRPEDVFHEQPTGEWRFDLARAWWMAPWFFLGLSWRAWSLRDHPHCPYLEYLVAYPAAGFVAVLFAFALLHSDLISGLDGWLYYCASPLLALMIGYLAIYGLETFTLSRRE